VEGQIISGRDESRIGGLVGTNNGIIMSSVNRAALLGVGDVGGIAAANFAGGDIFGVHNHGNISFSNTQNTRSIGGIVGWNNGGSVRGAINWATVAYTGASSASRNLAPNMGQIVGHVTAGTVISSTLAGSVSTGLLRIVPGIPLPHNQMQNAGNREVGRWGW